MLQILLHSSKTMTERRRGFDPLSSPMFIDHGERLAGVWQKASIREIQKYMQVSDKKASEVKGLYDKWSSDQDLQIPAIDAFKGDIYSGLQVHAWSEADRNYAHEHLLILSGLYGVLRACDGIMPYRLEMMYKLPDLKNMYRFWDDTWARAIDLKSDCIINLSATEYTKALLPYISKRVISPKFMTVSPKTGKPEFVTVHAKIARGAFARWLIQGRIDGIDKIVKFNDLGYEYDDSASTLEQPVFICKTFAGIGLSIRLIE